MPFTCIGMYSYGIDVFPVKYIERIIKTLVYILLEGYYICYIWL